ncbi:K(+)/H(+) antiporter [Tulasnella sp. 418]|nr:K(+)/H(+) antiporter [Tulasnella sp. 418]
MSSSGSLSRPFIDLGTSLLKRAAEQQGGLLTGKDPTEFNPKDPIRLWIIQIGIIILTTQILSLGLARMRQPKVIAEVLGGIVLGPTLMGRVPGFTHHIFPDESRPYLALTANIGLVLFLFLVGLEIDTKVIKRNAKKSLIISAGGILLPFGLGAAVAVPLYNTFIDPNVAGFGHFLLFVGVAFSITAFPVLCRILTELKLLDDLIGIIVLSAGVGNDIVGWILLALTVALVNASSGLTALYVLLCSVAWTLFILIPMKRAMMWLARWTGSISSGPTPLFMTATVLLVFTSALFTDIIGVHAIFGGFLAGLIIPHEGGLAITITEKLEDMVSIIFLPLYFTLSGLSTNLGLLDNGITWGYTILILVVAYIGKFVGGSVAAVFAGFNKREAATIGTLLSCKGLVELIVLNVGLSAGILDTRVFSMFVLEALVLTFASTPVTLWLYPPHLRVRASATGANFAGIEGGPPGDHSKRTAAAGVTVGFDKKTRFLVILDKMEHMSSAMVMTQLLRPTLMLNPEVPTEVNEDPENPLRRSLSRSLTPSEKIDVEALRLIELTDRTSDLMRSSSAVEDLILRDPLLNIYNTFGQLHDMNVVDRLAVAQYELYHERVGDFARESGADLVVLSWTSPYSGLTFTDATTAIPEPVTQTPKAPPQAGPSLNPFDALFRANAAAMAPVAPAPVHERSSTVTHSHFIRRLFASTATDVALFVDMPPQRGSSIPNPISSRVHLVVPFFGGPDDRLALEFVVQLCLRKEVTATVFRIIKGVDTPPGKGTEGEQRSAPEKAHVVDSSEIERNKLAPYRPSNTVNSMNRFPDTIYPNISTQTRLESDTADNICWHKYAPDENKNGARPSHPQDVEDALTRISFKTVTSPTPLQALTQHVRNIASQKRVIAVVGRAKRMAAESHQDEMRTLLGSTDHEGGFWHAQGVGNEMRKTLGDVASAFVASGTETSLLVMQAAANGDM